MTRTFACLALTLLAAAPAARGHDPEFTPEQLAKVRACVENLGKILKSGSLTRVAAWSFDLGEFTPHELGHVPEAIGDLDPDLREALRHVCQTTYHRRGPAGRLEGAREICFHLAGPRDADWLQAFRLLRRQKLGNDLERTVIALGRDDRPEVRLVAARLAKSLILFGRRSEGLLGTVLGCLTDRDPNVAAACTFHDALATREKRVVDRVVAALADDRALDPHASPILFLPGWRRVNDVVAHRLSWAIYMERKAQWKWRPTLDRSGEPEYEDLSPDAIRAWWKEHRDTFGFGTPAPDWRNVLDQVLVLDVGKPVHVNVAGGLTLTVTLRRYKESWSEGKPVTTADAEITTRVAGEEAHVANVGTPNHPDGTLSWDRATWSDGTVLGEVACRSAFLPTDKRRRVRLKLIVHIGHEERE
ncbi:MAG: hypothetical protein ACYTDU_12705 [Planctomycetota bacterium]|jgi:hypothetical protein